MNDSSYSRNERIDLFSDRFDRACRHGESPRIEAFLQEVEARDRGELLRELVAIELEYRRRRGEQPEWAEYLARFPDASDSLRSFFPPADPPKAAVDVTTLCVAPSGDELAGSRIEPTMVVGHGRLPASPPASAVQRFGDYDFLGKLGGGGMGVVFKARQRSLNRVVALKLIRAGELAGDEEVRRFRGEAEAAAQLDHPAIVPVYEVGQQQGQHFFSMGYVEGPTLAQELASGPLGPRTAAALVRQIAEAVQYAHEQGVIHRDLKPQNVLLTASLAGFDERQAMPLGRDSSSGSPGSSSSRTMPLPKITDFGLAKRMQGGSDLTQSGQILGTPSYMPPEQAEGQNDRVGPSADIYALGALLYCMLTGRPPFQAANPLETLRQVREQEPVAPRQLNPSLPLDLETIVLRCLRKEPARRYATAREVAEELGRFLGGEPILARPVSPFERMWRWCRRKPLAAGLIGATAAIVLLSTAAGWYRSQLFATDLQRQQVEQRRHEAEIDAKTHRYFGLLNGVREAAASPKPGWTWTAIDDLRQAAALDDRDSRTIRNLAARSLLAPDLRLERTIRPPGKLRLCGVAFDPSGERLAVGKRRGGVELEVFLYDAKTGELRRRIALSTISELAAKLLSFDRKFQEGVRSLAWSPDGKQLAIGTKQGRVHVWDEQGSDSPTVTFPADKEGIEFLAWLTHDPRHLVTRGKVTRLWRFDGTWREAANLEKVIRAVSARGIGVYQLDRRLAGLSLFDLRVDSSFWEQHHEATLAAYAGRTNLLAVEQGTELRLLDGRTGQSLAGLRDDLATTSVASADLQFSPDGHWLFALGDDRRLRVWDVGSRRLALLTRPFDGEEPQLAIAPQSDRLAVLAESEVQVFEFRPGIVHRVGLQGGAIDDVDLAPDGRNLVTLSERRYPVRDDSLEQNVDFWNCESGERTSGQSLLARYYFYGPRPGEHGSARYFAGGSRVAIASRDLGVSVLQSAADRHTTLWLELPEFGQPRSRDDVLTSANERTLTPVSDPLAEDGRASSLLPPGHDGPHAAIWRIRRDQLLPQSAWSLLFARMRVERSGEPGEFLRVRSSGRSTDAYGFHTEQIPDDGYHWYKLGEVAQDHFTGQATLEYTLELARDRTTPVRRAWIDQVVALPVRSGPPLRLQHLRGSRDSANLWGVYDENQILCWDASTGRMLGRWKNLQSTFISGRAEFDALTTGHNFALAGCRDGSVVVLRLAPDGKSLTTRVIPGPSPITSLSLTEDNTLLAVGTRAGQVRLIDVASGTVLAEWAAHDEDVASVAFVRSTTSQRPQGAKRREPPGAVTSHVESPDSSRRAATSSGRMPTTSSRRLATGSAAGQLRIWNLDRVPDNSITVEEWLTLPVGFAPIVALAPRADGTTLAVLVRGEFSARIVDLTAIEHELTSISAGALGSTETAASPNPNPKLP